MDLKDQMMNAYRAFLTLDAIMRLYVILIHDYLVGMYSVRKKRDEFANI